MADDSFETEAFNASASMAIPAQSFDLLQHHEVIRPEDPDRIFSEGGAQEAMLEARKAGKIRYIGFTGHKDPFIAPEKQRRKVNMSSIKSANISMEQHTTRSGPADMFLCPKLGLTSVTTQARP